MGAVEVTKEQLNRIRKDPLLTLANTPYALMATVIATLVACAALFSYFESIDFWSALYWSTTTMSTVGYGDISPVTGLGRLLTGAYQMWALFFLLPCAIFHIADKLIVEPDEFNDDDKHELQDQLNRIENALNNKEIA